MNILILGASGFVAGSLISKLATTDHQVLGISRNITDVLERFKESNNINFLKCDIAKEGLNKINFQPDIVINLAAIQPSRESLTWKDYFEGNVELVGSIINFCKLNKVLRLIHISTVSIYSSTNTKPYYEDSVPNPVNLYSLSKFMGESLLRVTYEQNKSSPEVIVLRFPSIYGAGHLDGLVYTYYSLAKENKDIEIYNEGKTMRNMLYIDDAVDSIVLFINATKEELKFDHFLIGSPNSLSSIDIASCIKEITGSSSNLVPVNKSSKVNEDVFIDITKFQSKYNFKLRTIEDGLNEFVRTITD